MFDENRLTRDDFLGRVELPLVSLPREAEVRPPTITILNILAHPILTFHTYIVALLLQHLGAEYL